MGIITDILGEGLKGLGSIIGYFFVFVAIVAAGLAVTQGGWAYWFWAVVAIVVGLGLIRYE